MPLWSANDDPTGRPNYANTASVYGVDTAEAKLKGVGIGPGWVQVTPQTGYITLSLVSGGTGYANSDVITVDGAANPATTNATANIVVGFSANQVGTIAVTSAQVNVTATGVDLTTLFQNNSQMFVWTNTTTQVVKTINKVTNSTSMNVVGAWAASNATANYGLAGVILSITNANPGTGFTTTSNLAISGTGVGANVVATRAGRAGRTQYEHMVVVKGMTNDAEDTIFPDT